jgi:type II secretory pathway component GspD/PulD (secretin)
MKTNPTLRNLFALIACSALAASSSLTFGQSKPTPELRAPAAPGTGVTMDVNFKDAPIADVIEFLSKKDEGFNVVVQQNVKDIGVSLKLRNVSAQQVLNALPFASEGTVQLEDLPDGIVGVKAAMPPQAFGNDGLPIRPECRIFSLSAYLAGKDEKAGAAAIEQFHQSLDAAVRMLNNASPQTGVKVPQLQVNPETKLLIAVGMPDDLAVVEQLVGALQWNAGGAGSWYRKGAGAPVASPAAGMPGAPPPQPVAPPPIGIPGAVPGLDTIPTPKAPGAGNVPQPVPTVPATKAR